MSAVQTSARPPPGHEIPAGDRGDTAGRRVLRLAFCEAILEIEK